MKYFGQERIASPFSSSPHQIKHTESLERMTGQPAMTSPLPLWKCLLGFSRLNIQKHHQRAGKEQESKPEAARTRCGAQF